MDFSLAKIKSRARRLGRPLKKAYRQVRPRTAVSIGENVYTLPTPPTDFLRLSENFEPWLNWVYATALEKKSGAFVDVGVNRGQSLAKMLRIAPGNSYIGFEPQAACVFYVEEFLRINHLDNCVIIPIGLSDHAGLSELRLNTFDPGDGAASIVKDYRPDTFYVRSMTVPVFRGDDIFLTSSTPISLLKIDVEGAELEVLTGLSNTIRERRPFVLFEVLNNYLVVTAEFLSDELTAHRNDRARHISSYFADAGYAVFNIRGKSLIRTEVIRPEVSADLSITNYLAVPDEFVSQLEHFVPSVSA